MKHEIESAAAYWSELLNYQTPYNVKQSFQHHLIQLLAHKYSSHWDTAAPERGQAYREIVCDLEGGYIDPILRQAAEAAGFSFFEAYGPSQGTRMWVDPGEVEVCFTEGPTRQRVIYQEQSRSQSPIQESNTQNYSTSPILYPSNSPVYYYPETEYFVPSCEYENMYAYTPTVNAQTYNTNSYAIHQPIEAGM